METTIMGLFRGYYNFTDIRQECMGASLYLLMRDDGRINYCSTRTTYQ